MKYIKAYVDGGANNHTKSHGYGSFAVFGETELIHSETFLLPAKTSNQAEYMSMIRLLDYINGYQKKRIKDVWTVYSDSRLTVNQITNGWKVYEPTLKILNKTAKDIYKQLNNIKIIWVPRTEIVEVLGH